MRKTRKSSETPRPRDITELAARNHVTTLWVAGLGTALVLTAVLMFIFGCFGSR